MEKAGPGRRRLYMGDSNDKGDGTRATRLRGQHRELRPESVPGVKPGYVSYQCTPGKKNVRCSSCTSLKCDCACHKVGA